MTTHQGHPRIHPTAYVGPGVELGADVALGPYVTLFGPLRVGDRVWIGAGASVGAPPEIASLRQNTAWTGDLEHQGVEIGADSVLRERVVIHQGSARRTVVGARCWLLNGAYLAHDVQLGDDVTVSAGVSVGGHCTIGSRATLGMNAVVHQRRVIGPGAMVGMGTALTGDVPPWTKVFGVPPRLHGVNAVGLSRAGAAPEVADLLASRYADGDLLLDDAAGLDAIAADRAAWRTAAPTRPVRSSLERAAREIREAV
ncbi:DapH/DapD/GlmU-related protein [Cellulosimicrobium aquatile]|uniref:DapH/DapD/GlmU-related protein n=1 Tax=Cellulosimicrobium aquatile TaxID=1612203 RepID=UPI0014598EE4|nr:acyl-ACP--UDP-N- acetylglucosamine O-acyltransferase [Cellulosimicrobium aquatile]